MVKENTGKIELDLDKMRIDSSIALCTRFQNSDAKDKECVYILARHVVQLCSKDYEQDVKRLGEALLI